MYVCIVLVTTCVLCMYACIHTYIHTYVYTCIHSYEQAGARVYQQVCFICVCMYICMRDMTYK